MGEVRIKIGPPKVTEFGKDDIMLDIENGEIYFKDRKGNLRKIISQPNLPSAKIGHTFIQGIFSGSRAILHNITASGNISASGTIFADTFESHGDTEIVVSDSLNITGNISASGDISASGLLYASSSEGNYTNIVVQDTGSGLFYTTASSAISVTSENTFKSTGHRSGDSFITGALFLSGDGHLTASGNISSSGTGSFGYIQIPTIEGGVF
jgi:hypothetical protein